MVCRSPLPDVEIPEQSFPSYVMEQFDQYGDRPAFINGVTHEVITYAQLKLKIEMLANGLTKKGFRAGDTLCIYAPNSPEYAVVFLAVTALGGINTTSNPLYTDEELKHQLGTSGAKFLITVSDFLGKAEAAVGYSDVEEIFLFDQKEGYLSFEDLLDSDALSLPDIAVEVREDLVVLPYSSGTTGLPKGVMLTHYNLVANIQQALGAEPLDDGEVLIGVLPFYHIYGMTVIMCLGLRTGATIVTMPRYNFKHFLELLQDYRVTTAYLVPPIVLALAKDPLVEDYDLSALSYITSGAAPLGEPLAQACKERLGCVVKQGYGLTETSPVTHFNFRVGHTKLAAAGMCLPNTEMKIIDLATGEDLPRGETGEVCLRGPQVMKGYHNNPEATADMIDAEGWLHTGDIGHVDDECYLYVVDRVKELIKYKGLQVPPAELEAVLKGHPAIADAAVIPSPDEEAGEVPKAFVVLQPGASATAEEIMAFVAERVAPFKKIRRLEFLDAIPKVASGKILRRELVKRERAKLQG